MKRFLKVLFEQKFNNLDEIIKFLEDRGYKLDNNETMELTDNEWCFVKEVQELKKVLYIQIDYIGGWYKIVNGQCI